jgi:hypothetical protein
MQRSNTRRIVRSLALERLFVNPNTCAKGSYMVQYMQEHGNPINSGRVPYVLEDLVEVALQHYVEEFEDQEGEIVLAPSGLKVTELRKAS